MILLQKIGNNGFSLIEVLIVGLIIFIAMFAVFQMYSYGLFQYPRISNLVQANHLLVREAENINSKAYTQIDTFLLNNYPKIINIRNMSFRISYTLNTPYTWCKIITLYVSWRDGTQTQTLSLEILRSIP
ncbi:MAG: hypothetical protein NZ841_02165 [Dictyoglomus sp.]|nr:hypothetical protein [Dictyoglomus sp.]MCX7941805.1 hypothetical protein [Dictyoglomaceae bacterium]MDW8188092.1 hypothetical protein [Dictyoglomus sp.]